MDARQPSLGSKIGTPESALPTLEIEDCLKPGVLEQYAGKRIKIPQRLQEAKEKTTIKFIVSEISKSKIYGLSPVSYQEDKETWENQFNAHTWLLIRIRHPLDLSLPAKTSENFRKWIKKNEKITIVAPEALENACKLIKQRYDRDNRIIFEKIDCRKDSDFEPNQYSTQLSTPSSLYTVFCEFIFWLGGIIKELCAWMSAATPAKNSQKADKSMQEIKQAPPKKPVFQIGKSNPIPLKFNNSSRSHVPETKAPSLGSLPPLVFHLSLSSEHNEEKKDEKKKERKEKQKQMTTTKLVDALSPGSETKAKGNRNKEKEKLKIQAAVPPGQQTPEEKRGKGVHSQRSPSGLSDPSPRTPWSSRQNSRSPLLKSRIIDYHSSSLDSYNGKHSPTVRGNG